MVIVGTRLFGANERFENAFGSMYLTTLFVHVLFVPLIPLKTFLVAASDPTSGVEVGMSWRNVASVWGQAFCVLLCIGGVIYGANYLMLAGTLYSSLTPEYIGGVATGNIDGFDDLRFYAIGLGLGCLWSAAVPVAVAGFAIARRVFRSATPARQQVLEQLGAG